MDNYSRESDETWAELWDENRRKVGAMSTIPFTPEERDAERRDAEYFAQHGSDRGFSSKSDAVSWLRLDATLRAVEAERNELLEEIEGAYEAHAAVEAERDALAEDLAEVTADRDSWWRYCAQHS